MVGPWLWWWVGVPGTLLGKLVEGVEQNKAKTVGDEEATELRNLLCY